MTALGLAKRSFLLFAFALFWMREPLTVGGLPVLPADLVFLFAALLWAAALLAGGARVRWSAGFWPLATYWVALAISALFSSDPRTSALKLATEVYLMALPVLTYNLVETPADLRRLFSYSLCGAAIVAVMGTGTLLLFPFFGGHSFLAWPLHHFGTLPPGPYPRLQLTFDYPAMMANYLALALMMVILAQRLGWIGTRLALLLGGGILVSALFALTPGFGGLLVMLGVWIWNRNRRTALGGAALTLAVAAGVLEVAVASVTPILHRTAPFVIHVPGLALPLAPSVRLLAWIDAARNFIAHPLVGRGIGVDAVHVPYASPEGGFGIVTDAHDMFLSLAAQAGIVGVVGIAALVIYAFRRMARGNDVVFGLALAFLSGLVVQGLVGSFEDARHLWLAYGLLLVAARLEKQGAVPDAGVEPATFGLQNRCSTD